MTLQRLDVLATREYQTGHGESRTSFTRIGVALPNKRGDGYTLLLDAMPAPVEGQFKMLLMPPRPRDGQQAPQQRQESQSDSYADPADDPNQAIPF